MIYISNVLYDYISVSFKCLKKTPTTYTHIHTVVLEHEIDFERSYALFAFHLGLCDKTYFLRTETGRYLDKGVHRAFVPSYQLYVHR